MISGYHHIISYHIILYIAWTSGASSKTPAPQPLTKQVSFRQCCKCSWGVHVESRMPNLYCAPPPTAREKTATGIAVKPENGGNLFLVASLRPPQTAACHVRRQRRQTSPTPSSSVHISDPSVTLASHHVTSVD